MSNKRIPNIGDEIYIIELSNYTPEFQKKAGPLPVKAKVIDIYDPEILVKIDNVEHPVDLYEWQYSAIKSEKDV